MHQQRYFSAYLSKLNFHLSQFILLSFMTLFILSPTLSQSEELLTERPPSETNRQHPDYLDPEESRTVNLYQKVVPAVVTIVVLKHTEDEDGLPERAIGSGVLITPECHILTAAHLVADAANIQVKTQDGKFIEAEIVFSEVEADIALIRFAEAHSDLPHAVLGNSDQLAIGQKAYAIGTPYGLENSFSVGYISSFREYDRLYDGNIIAEYIQTDAAINTGNSGGPLFNSKGEVIGIASHLITSSGGSEGVGLVVAINTIKQLLNVRTRIWLGLEGVYLKREALQELFNLDQAGGLLVERVSQGSPADEAGLQGGNTLAKIGGRDFMLGGDLVLAYELPVSCAGDCLLDAQELLIDFDIIPVSYLRAGQAQTTVIDLGKVRRNFLIEEPIATP